MHHRMLPWRWLSLSAILACDIAAAQQVRETLVDAPAPPPKIGCTVWRDGTPSGCPFPKSQTLIGIGFTGRHSDYHCGDTWYPSWASNGNLYSPWTDGRTDGVRCGSGAGANARTGHGVMIGDDPLKLIVKNTSPPKQASAKPYEGRYPCGSLVYNGIWYYGTYCLGPAGRFRHGDFNWNWPNLGPMPGFQISRDFGKTWTPSPLSPEKPLFPEPRAFLGPVKMGAPHFVDFGRNMQYSPDGKAYLLGMGAEENDPQPRPCIRPATGGGFEPQECTGKFDHANLSWITADQVYLARVTPSPETINDLKAYEFFAGHDAHGEPIWMRDFQKIKPLIEWNNHMGCATATYVPGLKKYLMCVTDGWPTVAKMDSYILEADEITGPWRRVTYMKSFGEQGYFLNFPSKFISEDGKTLWLCFSANFSPGWNGVKLRYNPPGGRYGLCLHEMKLLTPGDPLPPPTALDGDDNVARLASVTAGTVHPDYAAEGAVDGIVDGYPGDISREWASNGEGDTAMLRLSWSDEKTIDRVWLFDRPNALDQVTAGMLIFSDGSTLPVGALPDDAKQGVEVSFPPKKVKWLIFAVTAVKPGSPNVGLSEIAVFRVRP